MMLAGVGDKCKSPSLGRATQIVSDNANPIFQVIYYLQIPLLKRILTVSSRKLDDMYFLKGMLTTASDLQ